MLLCPFRRLPVINWEKAIVRSLHALRLDTMRAKFVAFGVAAAFVSTVAMTVMLYGGSRRSLSDRAGTELRGVTSDVAREVGVWLDQRLYDLRRSEERRVGKEGRSRWGRQP